MAHPKAFPNSAEEILRHVKIPNVTLDKDECGIFICYETEHISDSKYVRMKNYNKWTFQHWKSTIEKFVERSTEKE